MIRRVELPLIVRVEGHERHALLAAVLFAGVEPARAEGGELVRHVPGEEDPAHAEAGGDPGVEPVERGPGQLVGLAADHLGDAPVQGPLLLLLDQVDVGSLT